MNSLEGSESGVEPTPLAADPELGSSAMNSEAPEPEPEEPVRSLTDDLRDLATDAQTVFEAEKAFQSARLSYALSRGKRVAVGFAMAAALAYFAVIALVVGLLLALAPLITAWGALAVVMLSLILAAFLAFRSAMARLRRMTLNLRGEAGDPSSDGAVQ